MSSNKRRASDAAVGDAASLKVKSEKNEEKKSKTTDDIGKTSVEATPKKIKKEKKTKKEKGEPKEKKAKKEKDDKKDDKKDEKKDDKKDEKKDDKKDEKKVKKVKKEKKDEKTDEKTDEKKVKKVKKEKKEKKEKDGQEDKEKKEKKEKKPKKKDDDSSIVPEVQTGDISHHLTAIASPLATKADSIKKIHKLIGMASQDKTNFIRGLKHVAKQLRKGTKGLCILAGNVSPVDVISHFPSFCQEKEVPYIFLRTKEEIGSAAGVKRSITVALISDSLKDKEAKELMAAIIKDRSKAVPMNNDPLKMQF